MTVAEIIEAANDPTALNDLFATLHARSKDSPAKTWWHAPALHPALFRALRLAREEEGAIFAALPFRLHRSEAGVRILAAFPAPRILAPNDDDDWLNIETVLSWDPVTDTAEIMGDTGPALTGAIPPDTDSLPIFASPYAFFRALAEARAQWIVRRSAVGGDWRRKPPEPDLTPGLLLIGAPDKVRWPLHAMPEHVVAHGIDAQALNRALLRQARVPRASAAPSQIRSAA